MIHSLVARAPHSTRFARSGHTPPANPLKARQPLSASGTGADTASRNAFYIVIPRGLRSILNRGLALNFRFVHFSPPPHAPGPPPAGEPCPVFHPGNPSPSRHPGYSSKQCSDPGSNPSPPPRPKIKRRRRRTTCVVRSQRPTPATYISVRLGVAALPS